jgi:hypothetical protein
LVVAEGGIFLDHCRLAELVENGPHPPPGKTGAKFIIREDGHRLDLRYLKKSSDRHLELGYKVNFLVVLLSLVSALPSLSYGDLDTILEFRRSAW